MYSTACSYTLQYAREWLVDQTKVNLLHVDYISCRRVWLVEPKYWKYITCRLQLTGECDWSSQNIGNILLAGYNSRESLIADWSSQNIWNILLAGYNSRESMIGWAKIFEIYYLQATTHGKAWLVEPKYWKYITCRLQLMGERNWSSQNLVNELFAGYNSRESVIGRAKVKTIKLTGTLVAGFILCWSPYNIMSLW